MALYLEYLSAGRRLRVPLRNGIKIGRTKGDILFQDPLISSLHAEVIEKDGNFYLIDRGSRTGILVQNKVYRQIKLLKDTEFFIGQIRFFIAFSKHNIKAQTLPEQVIDIFQEIIKHDSYIEQDFLPFKKPLKLSFILGIQYEQVWWVGFGPRQFGSNIFDYNIEELGAPPICFTLTPHGNDVIFNTDFPNQVQVNYESAKQVLIEPGNIICIGDTEILFEYADDETLTTLLNSKVISLK